MSNTQIPIISNPFFDESNLQLRVKEFNTP